MSNGYSLGRETRLVTFLFVRFFLFHTFSFFFFFDNQRFFSFPRNRRERPLKSIVRVQLRIK